MKDESLENKVVTLFGEGWTIRRLSREFRISRDRVHRLLVSSSASRDATPREIISVKKKRPGKLGPYQEFMGELLQKYPDITGQRVYEHLKEKGFGGEVTIVRQYLNSIRQERSKSPIRMVETDPGQRGAHDWSDYQITFTGTGQREQVTFFSYILCYSRRQYINVVDDKTQKTLFGELIASFIYLDGVPREIKSDNQKACVDRWEMGQPVFNQKYLDFASHYLYRPLTITPGKPTENLKVERPFYYLERSFLNGREFKDREDLKAQLRSWLTEVNDVREHGTTRRRPIDLYLEEHPFLQVLPANHYDTSVLTHLVVNQESCVQWKGYQYVVSQKYMYELCPVRITEEHLVVYSPDGEPLVTHPLAKQGQKERYVGVPQQTRGKIDLVLSDVVTRLQGLGPEMSGYIEQVKRHKPGSWAHHLRRLLALKVNYRVDDILVAVRRAHQYKVYESGTIERFLENNSEPRYPIKLTFKPQNRTDDEH
jgi:transposase